MAQTPPTVDAEFEFVAHRYRVRWGEIAFFVLVTGFFVGVSYREHDPTASLFAVICAGMWWPLKRAWGALRSRGEVSQQQADWIVARLTRRPQQLKITQGR